MRKLIKAINWNTVAMWAFILFVLAAVVIAATTMGNPDMCAHGSCGLVR